MPSEREMVARYQRYRSISMRLNMPLMQQLTKGVLDEGGRDLGILKKGMLVFNSEDESSVLADYCIYNVGRDGRNGVQTLLAKSPPAEGSEEALVLGAMAKAWYTLLSIEAVESGVGVRVHDILRATDHLLIDMGLSRSAKPGDLFATRVIPFDGFIITTGAGLPLGGDNARRDAFLARIKKIAFDENITSFATMTPTQEKALARMAISTALASGASDQVRYEDPEGPSRGASSGYGRGESLVPIQAGGRVGRNERCPCGSGKKYKQCCGK